ncbi:MAG: sigma 54-interacting transcriptional regulator [Sedimentibacter sp.]
MDKKIGIIANSTEFKNIIMRLYENDIKEDKIIIDILDPDEIDEQGKNLEKKGAKAIIARSGAYRHTIGKVSVPVIQMKMYSQDILHAIMVAGKTKKDIVLVLSDLDKFNMEDWKDIIHSKIIIEIFYSVEEIESVIAKYKNKKSEIVIVGGGIPCKIADNYNLDYSNITISDESIHDVVSQARYIIDNLYEQKYRNNVLKTILDGVHDAVLAIDKEGKIILYNERANKLLKKDSEVVLNQALLDIFPELSIMMEVLTNKINKYNEIINLKRIVVTANIALIDMDGQVFGALCSFQDITKLQNLEKKIRYELNKKGLVANYKFEDITAYDPIMKETLAKAVKIGMSDSTAILYGESGTGKEMIAQSIHNLSNRSREPFVAINCAALTESLLESELFGYEEGAFTGARKGGKPGLFELAHGGTIFLDEINSVPLNLQTKLLRILEEREVMRIGSDYVIPLNVRILAAANESLKNKIKNGSFRSDLFYRLNVLNLKIPPLRNRKKDIIPIFKSYLCEYAQSSDMPDVNNQLEDKLMSYSWPGNVRELRNIAQRFSIFGEIDFDDMDIFDEDNELNYECATEKSSEQSDREIKNNTVIDLKEIDKFVELKIINMLVEQGMSKNEIAKKLGISRSSLWKKTNIGDKDMF